DGIEAEVHQLFGGDMHIEKETPWEEHDIENIQSLEGVIDAKTFIEAPNITWKTVDGSDREFSMMGFSGGANEADMFRMIEKSSHTSSLPNIYLGERAFNEWGGEIGETITLNTPKGSQEFFEIGRASCRERVKSLVEIESVKRKDNRIVNYGNIIIK